MNLMRTLTINGVKYDVVPVVPVNSVTLLADAWVGDAGAYSQVVQVPGVTPHTKVDLQPTAMQLAEFHYKVLAFVAENSGGVVTVYAVGDKPNGDHTIQTTLTEVEYSGRIRGNTVGTTTPRTDFNQIDPTKADYLKGRGKIVQTVNGVVPDENGNVEIEIPEPSVDIELDETLSKSGMAADAAAVGEALSKVGKPSGEEIATAVADYLEKNPIETTSNWDTLENKPFYEEIIPEVLREYTALDGFAPNPDFEGLYSGFENPAGFEIILGDTYVVMWDGIAYECVALDMSAVIPGAVGLGNAVVVGGEPTTEPFAIGLTDGMAVYIDVDTQNPKTSHEIGIYHNATVVKKMDEKFLPDCAATKEYVQQYIETYIEEALGGDY